MKRILAITIILILGMSAPAAVIAKSPVQKLKDPVVDTADHDLVLEEIVNQGSQAVPELILLLKEKSPAGSPSEAQRHWGAQVTAMNILGELKAKDSLTVLKDMLENSDSISAINNAARAIGNIGGPGAYIIIEQVLMNAGKFRYPDNNEERKKAAILALGLCENKKAIPLLITEMNNPNNDEVTRIYAAGSLGLLGVNIGLDVAAAGLASDDDYVRMAAVRALGVIGQTSALPALTELTNPRSDYVYRKAANLSIVQIQAEHKPERDKVGYIKQQLLAHPQITDFVQWGTMKLKKIHSSDAKKALQELSAQDAPELNALKQSAKIRVKTMN